MRVIAGEARGFTLKGPAGVGTRPMPMKLKGALFSVLENLGVAAERVLDLYAGTGQLGIEALSRGATSAEFVEQNPAAAAVIRANLAHTKYDRVARVHQIPVTAYLARPAPPFDLILLDPPYADPDIAGTVARLAASSLVQSGTVVAVGHAARAPLPERIGRLTRLRVRCHGDSCFSVYEADLPAGEEDAPTGPVAAAAEPERGS